MPALPIPRRYYKGFQKLIRLDDSSWTRLANALANPNLKPTMQANNLAVQVAEYIPEIPVPELEEIVTVILSLYYMLDYKKDSIDTLVRDLVEGIDVTDDIGKEGWQKDQFASHLLGILSGNEVLNISAKAAGVLTDHEHIFCDVRILTDIRPVFGSDISKVPDVSVTIYMLKIGYHEGRTHKEFFVALNAEDLRELREALDRAEAKTLATKALLEKAGLTNLDTDA
jgi:uncharacterized protein (DUF1778 family)